MKKLILFFAFTGLILSINAQDYCDTLKWKTIRTVYGNVNEGYYNPVGDLDGAEIDIDAFPVLSPGIEIVNISNDIFSSEERYLVLMYYYAYADTGLLAWNYATREIGINKEIRPNETVSMGFSPTIDLLSLINDIKDLKGVDFEQISYWELIIGITAAIQDRVYSERVFYAGADTSTFYVVKTPVNIQEIENEFTDISIFPNPASSQFTVTNTENATIHLYNMQGQKIKQVAGEEENTVIQTSDLSAGMYVLKLEKKDATKTKKIQIVH